MDCYVHASPDLLPRRRDDVEVARECTAAGITAAVHRHHFSETTGRSSLVQSVSWFSLLGAIVLNESVGGINPTAVEVALRSGAVWVNLPTLSTAHFRASLGGKPPEVQGVLGLGSGSIRLIDEAGEILPEVHEVAELVRDSDAVLGLGYGSCSELRVLREKFAAGRAVLTYPHISGLQPPDVADLLADTNWYLELCAHRMHPAGPLRDASAGVSEALALLHAVGPERCILSSDGGMADAPPPATLLVWALERLHEAGIQQRELRAMVCDNPHRLLAAKLAAA